MSSTSVLLFTFSDQNVVRIHVSDAYYMLRPSHPLLFDQPDNIWQGVQIRSDLKVHSICETTELYAIGWIVTCSEWLTAKLRGVTNREDAVKMEDRGRNDGSEFSVIKTGQHVPSPHGGRLW
jgi:hypothetical protein